jgi:hypothetical protein
LVTAVLASLAAGAVSLELPFWPAGWWLGIGALAGGATLLRPRFGLALTLAAPVLPLGNLSLGLALVYAAVAALWFAACWREPAAGFLPAVGPLAGPVGALGLLPVVFHGVRGHVRRAAGTAAAVVLAAAADARDAAPISGSDRPLAVVQELVRVAAAHPAVPVDAAVFGVAAVMLPYAIARGLWWIAGVGAWMVALPLFAAPAAPAAPIVAAVWATCGFAAWRHLRES